MHFTECLHCISLKTVTFEENSQLKTIDGSGYYGSAFKGCKTLESIEIPASVEKIFASAFQDCVALKNVTFENGSKLKHLSSGTFYNCPSLESITIPAGVEAIYATTFYNCTSLKTVTFEENSQLKQINEGNSNDGAFYGCTSLTTVDASACTALVRVGSYAFYNNTNLRIIYIGAPKPPACGYYAFNGISVYSVLKVPDWSVDDYKAADGWNSFSSISGFNE